MPGVRRSSRIAGKAAPISEEWKPSKTKSGKKATPGKKTATGKKAEHKAETAASPKKRKSTEQKADDKTKKARTEEAIKEAIEAIAVEQQHSPRKSPRKSPPRAEFVDSSIFNSSSSSPSSPRRSTRYEGSVELDVNGPPHARKESESEQTTKSKWVLPLPAASPRRPLQKMEDRVAAAISSFHSPNSSPSRVRKMGKKIVSALKLKSPPKDHPENKNSSPEQDVRKEENEEEGETEEAPTTPTNTSPGRVNKVMSFLASPFSSFRSPFGKNK